MTEAQIKGIVYILRGNGKVYIGSTTRTAEARMAEHRSINRTCTARALFDGDGVITIQVLEDVHCNTKQELKARERYHMELYPERVNRQIPGKSRTEYLSEYRQANKERIVEYRQANKAHADNYKATWYQDNKERIAERNNEPYTCACKSVIKRGSKSMHEKTRKHQLYLDSIE